MKKKRFYTKENCFAAILGFAYMREKRVSCIPFTNDFNGRVTPETVLSLVRSNAATIGDGGTTWTPSDEVSWYYDNWIKRQKYNSAKVEKYLALSVVLNDKKTSRTKKMASGREADELFTSMTLHDKLVAYTFAKKRGQPTHHDRDWDDFDRKTDYG